MKNARAKPSSNKGQRANSVFPRLVPPMNRLFKFHLKLFIGGADQSKTKVGSMAFIGLIGLQNEI